ncbi:MAG: mycothiol conjugate amidase Mca [Propionibacteriaceae bacterium]|jgi:mycothiol S-conjugate amidase|nr:mycothiol conjugate amidase Mca [Propionibacteriaceae bacterium]
MEGMLSHELRLMHIHAHPDDESSKGAATTAYYVRQGVQVSVVTCTGGERGSILNPKMDTPENQARLPELREAEMAKAAQILGIHQIWLGYPDSGFPDPDDPQPLDPDSFAAQSVESAAGRLVKVIREVRPQVVTTYNERGGYPHPDHLMTHKITVAAVAAAADPDQWPEHGPAWQVSKLYYDVAFHRRKWEALGAAMSALGIDNPYAARLADMPRDPEEEKRLTTFIPCADFFAVRDQALLAHTTQIDPAGFWFAVPLSVQMRVWPTEDYQLVWSKVPTELPESDLFAGLR